MIGQLAMSERHACRLVGLTRDSYRNPPVMSEKNAQLSAAIVKVTVEIRRVHIEHRSAYGGVKTWRTLNERGIACGKHRVARLRHEHGIEAKRHSRQRLRVEHHKTG